LSYFNSDILPESKSFQKTASWTLGNTCW